MQCFFSVHGPYVRAVCIDLYSVPRVATYTVDLNDDGKRHDDDGDQEVGDGERREEVVGHVLQTTFGSDGDAEKNVSERRGDDYQAKHDGSQLQRRRRRHSRAGVGGDDDTRHCRVQRRRPHAHGGPTTADWPRVLELAGPAALRREKTSLLELRTLFTVNSECPLHHAMSSSIVLFEAQNRIVAQSQYARLSVYKRW